LSHEWVKINAILSVSETALNGFHLGGMSLQTISSFLLMLKNALVVSLNIFLF
jgi:hypothetical protein